MNSSHLLISSKFRDRLLYPNPSEFTIQIRDNRRYSSSNDSIFNADNPISEQLPLYNFCFSTFDNNSNAFLTSIKNMHGNKIILNENIYTLFNRKLHENINLKHTLQEQQNVLKNLNIEIEIADSIFTRKIVSFNPIDNSIMVNLPFPFLNTNNNSTELSCRITTTTTENNEILCNGNFLSSNDFYYYDKKKFLYNISDNKLSRVTISDNGESLKFVPNQEYDNKNQQYMLIFSDTPPSNYGKILKQINQKFYSFQFDSVTITSPGLNYKNDDIVVLFPSNNHINSFSSTYFHKYKIVNMTSNGNIINLQNNLQLISVGSQELNTGFNYFILPENNLQKTIDSSVCSLEVNSLNLLFILSVKKHFYARKKITIFILYLHQINIL